MTITSGNCAFCGKPAGEVFRLIAGPTCMICSECVGRSANMIADELANVARAILALGPTPPDSQGGEP